MANPNPPVLTNPPPPPPSYGGRGNGCGSHTYAQLVCGQAQSYGFPANRGNRGNYNRGRPSAYNRGARGQTRGNNYQYPLRGSYSSGNTRGQGLKRNVRSPPVNPPVTSKQRVASRSGVDLFHAMDTSMSRCSVSPKQDAHQICIGSQVI